MSVNLLEKENVIVCNSQEKAQQRQREYLAYGWTDLDNLGLHTRPESSAEAWLERLERLSYRG